MKHQMLSILTSLSVAFAPLASYAGKGEGSRWPKKSNCDDKVLDEIWRSEDEELKREIREFYKGKKKPVDDADFCNEIEQRVTEAKSPCPDGNCPRGQARKKLQKQDAEQIEDVAREQAPRRYRDDGPPPPPPPPQRAPAPSGGGFGGDMFGGNPMGYMMVGGIGALIGAMMAGNNRQQQPMFRSPYGPYMPGMGPGMMGPRPPPFMPINRGFGGGFGGAPAIAGGGFGAPGVISQFNGANIYNNYGGYYGGIGGNYMGSGAPAYSTGYFNNPPGVINAATGARIFSVGGSAPQPTYNLLGR